MVKVHGQFRARCLRRRNRHIYVEHEDLLAVGRARFLFESGRVNLGLPLQTVSSVVEGPHFFETLLLFRRKFVFLICAFLVIIWTTRMRLIIVWICLSSLDQFTRLVCVVVVFGDPVDECVFVGRVNDVRISVEVFSYLRILGGIINPIWRKETQTLVVARYLNKRLWGRTLLLDWAVVDFGGGKFLGSWWVHVSFFSFFETCVLICVVNRRNFVSKATWHWLGVWGMQSDARTSSAVKNLLQRHKGNLVSQIKLLHAIWNASLKQGQLFIVF